MRRRSATSATTWAAASIIIWRLLVPGAARAQSGGVEARETQARKECAAGNYRRGVELLADLFVQTTEPIYVYNQGRCYEENGRLEEAVTRFREYARKLAGVKGSEAEIAEVEARIKTLEERLARARAQTQPPGLRFGTTPEPAERPVYHRAWFWVAIGAVAAGTVTAVLLARRTRENGPPACPDCNLSIAGVPTR